MVERAAVNRDVAGSSPASGANFKDAGVCSRFAFRNDNLASL